MKDTPGSVAFPTELQEASSESETTKASILIVEDEAGPREALKMILRPFFNLYAVDNTEVAMQVLHAPAFHGQTAAIYLELDRKVSAADFALAIQGEHVQMVAPPDDALLESLPAERRMAPAG